MDTIALNSIPYDYIREASYLEYLNEKIYQENKLMNLIQETLDLHKCRTVKGVNETMVLYEVKLSDNIKAKWNKFITFMKSIYQKFIANLSKVLVSEKTYLKKYQDIILKKPGKEIEFVYYGNYDKGIQRITSVKLPEFDWATMSTALLAEGDGDAVNLLMKGSNFSYNDGENLATQLKEFYVGYEDGETRTTIANFNLRKAYDFCNGFDKIKQRTDDDMATLEKATRKIEDAINKHLKDKDVAAKPEDNKPPEANAQPETPKQQSTGGDAEPDTDAADIQQSRKNVGEAAYLRSLRAKAFREAEENDKPAPGNTGLKITDVSKASASYDGSKTPDKATLDKNANAADGVKEDNDVNKAVNKYISIAKSIISAKWTASEQIARDYMKIIHAHVKSYAGEKSEENTKSAAPQTDFGNKEQKKEEAPKEGEEAKK